MKRRGRSVVMLLLALCVVSASLGGCETADGAEHNENVADTLDELKSDTGTIAPNEAEIPEVGYNYDVALEDGSNKTLTLYGYDPKYYASTYEVQLDDSDTPNRVVIHQEAGGTGYFIDKAYVLDGKSGEVIPITPVADVLDEYVEITSNDDEWIFTVSDKEYVISKSQFSDYTPGMIYDIPNLSCINDFVIIEGQLLCTISPLCAGILTGYSEEKIYIRYGYDNGSIVPVDVRMINAYVYEEQLSSEEIAEIMNMEITFVGKEKREMLLGDWFTEYGFHAIGYSTTDLDHDGESEFILRLARGENIYVGFLILHAENETVYVHELVYKAFANLKSDGTFDHIGNLSISEMTFDDDSYTISDIAHRGLTENDTMYYYIGDKQVTEEEYTAFSAEQSNKPDASWYKIK